MTPLQRLAVDVSPIFLRVLLAVTFIWAGMTKVVAVEMPVTSQNAEALVAIGAIEEADRPDPDGDGGGMKVRNVNGVALTVYTAANPGQYPEGHDRAGEDRPTTWPPALGSGPWPVALAWTVALTEIIAGAFLLVGFLARIAGAAVAGTMLGAMWLSQFGPAIQEGATKLGFLPDHSLMSIQPWQTLMWQFALLMAGMAVLFAGAGAASMDRVLFSRKDKKKGDPKKKSHDGGGG